MENIKRSTVKEKLMELVFLMTAVFSILAVALICIFLFVNGIPAMKEIGFLDFLTGTQWKPGNDKYGIFPMILGSIYVTGGALIIGVPIGILTSVFMAKFCSAKLYRFLKPIVNLMAGIPSIVYGFFGLVVLVPFIREHFQSRGQSILCAAILLGIMILPTIIGASEPAIRAVDQSYYEGALALGATHERSVFTVLLPAAKSGIFAAVVLGVAQCARGDDGGYDGCWQPAARDPQYAGGHPYSDDEYCHGNGLCDRSAPRGADCDRSCAVCIYFDH